MLSGLLLLLVMLALLLFMVISHHGGQEQTEEFDYQSIKLSESGRDAIPSKFIKIYQNAAEEYNLPWTLLAAIHRVETVFSTIPNMESPVGATGHFQFMEKTWIGWEYPGGTRLGDADIPNELLTDPAMIKKYGGFGVDANGDGKADPFDIEDAAYSAAHYLASNGAGENLEKAIFAYNRADWYVEKVMSYFHLYTEGYMEGGTGRVEIAGDRAWLTPHTKNVTSRFGMRWGRPHNGIDIAGGDDTGQPVLAFMDGIVSYSQFNEGGYGYMVIIKHQNGWTTYYAHLDELGLPEGTKVRAGQKIGSLGNSGDSTNPHLHFEIRVKGKPVDPYHYLAEFLGG